MTLLYFAYGSNMHAPRMIERVPSARAIEPAHFPGRTVKFNKHGADGTGKANLVDRPADVAWGVLYEVAAAELHLLDRFEGGYCRERVELLVQRGHTVTAETYISSNLIEPPVALKWYKELVVTGARAHHLPAWYIEHLQRLPSRADGSHGSRARRPS